MVGVSKLSSTGLGSRGFAYICGLMAMVKVEAEESDSAFWGRFGNRSREKVSCTAG